MRGLVAIAVVGLFLGCTLQAFKTGERIQHEKEADHLREDEAYKDIEDNNSDVSNDGDDEKRGNEDNQAVKLREKTQPDEENGDELRKVTSPDDAYDEKEDKLGEPRR